MKIVVVNGRYSPVDIRIDRRTLYGNLFRVEVYGRERAIWLYERWIEKNPWIIDRLFEEVKAIGKDVVRIGCHCKPLHCHGDVLKRLLDERLRQEGVK